MHFQLHGQDILQWDFIDHYRNLTIKSILGLKWASDFCSTAKFVVKLDDDVFFNAANLMSLLISFKFDVQIAGRYHQLNERQVERFETSRTGQRCVRTVSLRVLIM